MTEATPRPRPWQWRINGPKRDQISNGNYVVAKAIGELPSCETEAEDNAALIVRAVNAYDEALALLREAREYVCDATDMNRTGTDFDTRREASKQLARIDAFLAKENSNG